MGFAYPRGDREKCVDCGLCEKVCPFNAQDALALAGNESGVPLSVYGARHKEPREVEGSRSGAAFIALSDVVLERGGVVYGAVFDSSFRVVHARATTPEGRNKMRGSKYVQSDLEGIFPMVRCDLKDGLDVLFTGTPCQTAGLRAYIGKRLAEHLYLVDMICTGVPGPRVWSDYLAYIEKKQGARLTEVNCRDKQMFGWRAHKETFVFEGSTRKRTFHSAFYDGCLFRPSCTTCPFCNTCRPSDITIGDFWGVERTRPDFNRDNRGVSLLLINSERGRELLSQAQQDLCIFAARLEDAMQNRLHSAAGEHPQRATFERDYISKGFAYAARRAGLIGLRYEAARIKRAIKRRLGC